MFSFERYFERANKRWEEYRKKNPEAKVSQQTRDRFYQLYMNRKLVWATWILVIFTMILSGLTLYFR